MPLLELAEAHLDLVLEWRNSPTVRNGMFSNKVISHSEHLAWFSRISADDSCFWFLHTDKTGTPDGVVNFTTYRPAHRDAFWGFYKNPASPSGTGTALGIEALDWAFGTLALHKLNAEVLSTNTRSQRFHEKLGFTLEGKIRDSHLLDSVYLDVWRYGILVKEWREHRSALAVNPATTQ